MTRGILLTTALAVGTLAAAFSGPASAAGLYGSLFGGANMLQPMTINSSSSPYSDDPRTLYFNNGYIIGGAVGTSFGPIRTEGEFAFRSNGLNHVTVQGEGTDHNPAGSATAFSVMANAWWDIPVGGGLTPYVGGGVGFANVNLKANSSAVGDSININTSNTVGAMQLGAGLAWRMSPTTTLTFDYRYFTTGPFSFPLYSGGPSGTTTYKSQSVMVGFRMGLGP